VEKVTEDGTGPVVEEVKESKRPRKQVKTIEGRKITVEIVSTGQSVTVDADDLTPEIQEAAMMHGLSQKLGDSAAGLDGQEALDAVTTVATGIVNGDWKTKAPAAKSVKLADLQKVLDAMPEEMRKAAVAQLSAEGIELPSQI
jgi:hypothetical protein